MRLSVSDLDSYRWWRDNEDSDLDELLARLRRQTPPTRAMLAGTALHSVLKAADALEAEVVERDGFKFRFACDIALELPKVRELKGQIIVPTSVGPVTLVGIVDGLRGTRVYDHKLTGRFDIERYADSFQWRCYLEMFGGASFVYNVFVGRDDPKSGEWIISEFHRFPLYAYPAMREDVLREINSFAQFVAEFVPEKMAA